jgi:hypothetical protein
MTQLSKPFLLKGNFIKISIEEFHEKLKLKQQGVID